ncbi:RNA polymerase sigma factor [Rhodohalobacter sp. 614A]|uniref:RNA polymerase sigma factor n=1 Tax=Rhodohalobacter sp. 614A TaxID=2908649 RepID=UPI001F33AEA1|nr:sigma-70 family RNA polymerase sigma factor [Rhodohalobacter sp. 614A]
MHLQVTKPLTLSNPGKLEYEELWTEVRHGDKDALARLFCLNYSLLFNYGYKIIANEALVKDCIQDLFLIIWRRHEHLNDAYSVKAYLIQSLRRLLLKDLSKQENRSERNEVFMYRAFENIYNVEELMIHFEVEVEQKQKLKEAIQSLNNREREAIFLKFYGGASNQEIAQIMNINIQSVYNHISKALNNLKAFINFV